MFIHVDFLCWLGWSILKIGEGYLLKIDIPPGPHFFSLNSCIQMDLSKPKKNEICHFEFQDCYIAICPATSCQHTGNNHLMLTVIKFVPDLHIHSKISSV